MKILRNILIFFLLSNLFTGFAKTIFYYNLKGMLNRPSDSILESKKKGAFIQKLQIEPHKFTIGNKSFKVEEIWLERTNVILFSISVIPFIIDFPLYMNTDNYNICLYFHGRKEIFPYFFVIKGNGSSFSTGGTNLYNEVLRSNDWKNLDVLLTDSFKNPPKISFKISR